MKHYQPNKGFYWSLFVQSFKNKIIRNRQLGRVYRTNNIKLCELDFVEVTSNFEYESVKLDY